LSWDDDRVRLNGLERRTLEDAALGRVLENVQESAPAVGAVYHRLDTDGLLSAEWFGSDDRPLQVELRPTGRMLLRSRV
jgi:hypothetical protein